MADETVKAEQPKPKPTVDSLTAELVTLRNELDGANERIESLMTDHPVEINFVVNSSKNEKAPKYFALIDNGFPFRGTVTSLPVYVKDGIPSCSVPNNYGNAPIQAKRMSAYQTDPEGESVLSDLDAAVRIAWYAWVKSKVAQPFGV